MNQILSVEVDRDAPLTFLERASGVVGSVSFVIGLLLVGLCFGCVSSDAGSSGNEKGGTMSAESSAAFPTPNHWWKK